MAPKQAQFLIPQDRILCSLVQADKEHGVINREFLFDGEGNQFNGGAEPDASLPKLVLPKDALVKIEGDDGVVVFPVEQYIKLLREGKVVEAGTLQGEFHAKLNITKVATGRQGLADLIIDALFAFLATTNLDGWVVNRNSVVCRIPARETPETPVVIVVQPQPVWGAR